MRPALGLLLALLTVEGLLLVFWPAHVRAIIQNSGDKPLRAAGIVELILVIVIFLVVCCTT